MCMSRDSTPRDVLRLLTDNACVHPGNHAGSFDGTVRRCSITVVTRRIELERRPRAGDLSVFHEAFGSGCYVIPDVGKPRIHTMAIWAH